MEEGGGEKLLNGYRVHIDPSRAKCCTKACNNDKTVIFFLRSAQKADMNIRSDLWKIFDIIGREKAGGRKLQWCRRG